MLQRHCSSCTASVDLKRWRHVVAEWKDHISLFVPELPGYGFSSLPEKHDKRTIGCLLVEALQQVFDAKRPVIWCGHDRGGRIGHRLIVDNNPTHNIKSAILIDIVPTVEQWRVFSNPRAGAAYYHWPFLATPSAPAMIQSMGGDKFAEINLNRAKGSNEAGTARFLENDAMAHYCNQFSGSDCITGSCEDYLAGATIDVDEQDKDQTDGKKVSIPLFIIYSASNLGRMHDVEAAWADWVNIKPRYVGVQGGYGHYLPEEAPDQITKLVYEWIDDDQNAK